MRRFFDKVSPEPNSGCWLWCGTVIPDGYGMVRVGSRTDGSRRGALAHRFSWEMHRGPIPTGLHVCHHCDVPSCVNPDHLFLGTDQDNTDDKMRKGRHATQRGVSFAGHRSGHEKLNASDIPDIRRRLKGGELHRAIAADYGVVPSNISQIAAGKTWRHV